MTTNPEEIRRQIEALQAQLDAIDGKENDEIQSSVIPRQPSIPGNKDNLSIGGAVKDSSILLGNGNVIQNYYGDPPRSTPSIDKATEQYLDFLIANHHNLPLQGIRAGNQPLSVALEKVYISLSILDKSVDYEANSKGKPLINDMTYRGDLSVESALRRYRRLVIMGDPGCGKTTLLSYLAITFARDKRFGTELVHKRLGLDEIDNLPIFLPLRGLGFYLKEKHPFMGKDGPTLLLDYLFAYYQAQEISLPQDFFSAAFQEGRAILLLDGMDEVGDSNTRQRVARLIETFVARYPDTRYVVTSREVGYDGAARIGASFGLSKVRDFNATEVRRFLHDWTRVVELTLAHSRVRNRALNDGEIEIVYKQADKQSKNLADSIDGNSRVAELAVNPLLLTVIALVHRYRAKLPERRSELYEEAVEVLLGHWDSAKGMEDELDVVGIKLDSGDRRSFLEPVAFWMHERKRREIELHDLKSLLLPRFQNITGDKQKAVKAVMAFLLGCTQML
jgi:predicted NACHT family NTPase